MYLKKYTNLNKQENRQHQYKEAFKIDHPKWNDSMVLLTNWFNNYILPDSKILDIGCGNGNWVIDDLKRKFSSKIGLDVDKKSTKKNTTLDKIYYGSIESTKFRGGEFDCAVSLWTLEHLLDPQKAFIEINRVLKMGGILGFCTPNKNYFLIRIKTLIPQKINKYILKSIYGREEEGVFKTFYKANSKRVILQLAENSGFKVIKLEENFDPSYTSFNRLTYNFSKFLYKLNVSIFKSHIIGLVQKTDR